MMAEADGGGGCVMGGAINRTRIGRFSPQIWPMACWVSIYALPTSPSRPVSGRIWSVWLMATCLGARMMMSGGHIWNPNRPLGRICGENRPILKTFRPSPSFCHLPSDSVSFRYLPSASISGRIWSVWLMATCLGARMVMSGEHIWKPNRPWAKFSEKIDRF